MKVHRGKYGHIHLIASLTAGLSRYHDEFAVAVVDEVGFLSFFLSFFFHLSSYEFVCVEMGIIVLS